MKGNYWVLRMYITGDLINLLRVNNSFYFVRELFFERSLVLG